MDMLLTRVVKFSSVSSRDIELVLIAPPGDGNIGDQALLESALDNSAGSVVVVTRSGSAVTIPCRHADRVSLACLPRLLYGDPVRRYFDYWKYCQLVKRSLAVWVIGADVMDGAYNPRASIARFSCALSASRLGCDSRVLGFSWNSHSADSARRVAKLSSAEVKLLARDPNSHERLLAEGIHSSLVADIVFARATVLGPSDGYLEWVEGEKWKGKRVLLVNASGLLAAVVDQPFEFSSFLEELDADEWSCVLIPHVMRSGNDDLRIIEDIAVPERMQCLRIRELLSPDVVFAVTSQVDVVVTGRMHLAVLSTLAGTYSITLASQGKVEGLYALLGRTDLCVAPKDGCGVVIGHLVTKLAESGELDKGLDESRVSNLVQLSSRNFS